LFFATRRIGVAFLQHYKTFEKAAAGGDLPLAFIRYDYKKEERR
jgi:hypothetical protein